MRGRRMRAAPVGAGAFPSERAQFVAPVQFAAAPFAPGRQGKRAHRAGAADRERKAEVAAGKAGTAAQPAGVEGGGQCHTLYPPGR